MITLIIRTHSKIKWEVGYKIKPLPTEGNVNKEIYPPSVFISVPNGTLDKYSGVRGSDRCK